MLISISWAVELGAWDMKEDRSVIQESVPAVKKKYGNQRIA
jgi:hypothetical protein